MLNYLLMVSALVIVFISPFAAARGLTDAMYACMVTGCTLGVILLIRVHVEAAAAAESAMLAYWIYKWWNDGGGTRLGRRLKKAFKPVRRTHPVAN